MYSNIKIKAKKTGFIYYIIFYSLFILVVFVNSHEYFLNNLLELFFLFIPLLLFLWIYFSTYYIIKEDIFFYRSAFLRGKIKINDINELIIGKTSWSGTKPALAKKGILIKYNNYNEVYIAPIDNNTLVKEFLKVNSNIKITKEATFK